MKHETKSLLIFAGIFLVVGYIYEKNYSPAAVQQAAITQLQAQGNAGTNIPVTTMPITTTLIAEPVA